MSTYVLYFDEPFHVNPILVVYAERLGGSLFKSVCTASYSGRACGPCPKRE